MTRSAGPETLPPMGHASWAICVYLLVNQRVLYQISGKSQEKLLVHLRHKPTGQAAGGRDEET
jgi:hypothetical protein